MIIYEEILREFQKQKVRSVIVGGIAFNLLGGYRVTLDLDILAEMSNQNLYKLINILKKAGYHVRQPVDPILMADKKTREDWIKNKHMKAFNFYKDAQTYQAVDILIDAPVTYEEAVKDSIKIDIGNLVLPVIAMKKLIKMKKNTGREKDSRDVKELKVKVTGKKK